MSKQKSFFDDLLLDGDDKVDVVPIFIGDDKDDDKVSDTLPETIPLLIVRNAVLFPSGVLPINVSREQSEKLVRDMHRKKGVFVVAMQKDAEIDKPSFDDVYDVGTVASVLKMIDMPDGGLGVLLRGSQRVHIDSLVSDVPYHTVHASELPDVEIAPEQRPEFVALCSIIIDKTIKMLRQMGGPMLESAFSLKNIEPGPSLLNTVAASINIDVRDKQRLLQTCSVMQRAKMLAEILSNEVNFVELKSEIEKKVSKDISQQQREYMLQQQMRTIQNELGDDPVKHQIDELRAKGKLKVWPDEVRQRFEKELDRLQYTNPHAGDYSQQLSYVETLVELPWMSYTKDNFNINKAAKRLDVDHYGLDKVKERILEHLAVLKLKGDMKSPILCLYGPPGVGKTSLGKSIAAALGRKYVRMSLGGLHDEAEIRGHRKTYIGAMPGRILQNIKKAGSSNPVFILDEIDKVSSDFHGDPASALLEVLDPEQNSSFHDNYIDVDYDLSKVLFIATANDVSRIARPLLDRMELIEVSGYVLDEKVEIAEKHLLPKEMTNHGLDKKTFTISKKVMSYIVDKYTRESGVRSLDNVIANICRKVALKVAKGENFNPSLSASDVVDMLGAEKYTHDIWEKNLPAGVVTGLAWTAVGGEILFIETSVSKGKGKLTMTGNLGDVMKESAVLAVEYVRSNADRFGLDDMDFDEHNFHIHVPEGAVPKDGPSAGITMVTSVVSALTQRKVKKRIAMTGEITLRGQVLPVGGIKEKILAAKRAGICDLILSAENRKNVEEINAIYVEGLTFHYVKTIVEVVELALE